MPPLGSKTLLGPLTKILDPRLLDPSPAAEVSAEQAASLRSNEDKFPAYAANHPASVLFTRLSLNQTPSIITQPEPRTVLFYTQVAGTVCLNARIALRRQDK